MFIFKHSISQKLILYVILFSSLITFVTSAFQLFDRFESDVTVINIRLDDVFKYYTQPVTNTLWTANYNELKTNLEGIIKIPNINHIEVTVNDASIVSLGERKSVRIVNQSKEILYLYQDKEINLGTLHIQASLESAYQNVFEQIIQILISNGIKIFLVAFFILYIFHNLVTRHLKNIAGFTHNLNYKKLDKTLILDRKISKNPDELDEVVMGISTLQGKILSHIKQMELSEAKVLLLLHSTAEAIYGVDTFGACTFINASCLRMLGYEHESELLGKNMHEIIHYKYPDGTEYPVRNCHINQAYLTGNNSHKSDEVLWRKDGTSFAVEYWSYPIFRDDEIIGAVVTFMDITERIAAENELRAHKENLSDLVAERTQELENSNKALEAFSYSVSHDLRTPLRAINGFSQILIEDYGDTFNSGAKEYFIRITKAVKSMSMLIDDLLSLASVSQSELKIVDVNVRKIINRIFDQLWDEYPERKVSIDINIENQFCDKNLIKIVWENLIRNAWKYTSKSENAKIEIGLTDDTKNVFYIKDNGVGFDMKYVDKIFLPFQRLHKKEEFEGTGIGLATVERIIKRHGGEIRAESSPNNGTTIFFSLYSIRDFSDF